MEVVPCCVLAACVCHQRGRLELRFSRHFPESFVSRCSQRIRNLLGAWEPVCWLCCRLHHAWRMHPDVHYVCMLSPSAVA